MSDGEITPGLNVVPPENWNEFTDEQKVQALTGLTEALGTRLDVCLQILEEVLEGANGTDEEWLEGKPIIQQVLTHLFDSISVKRETMQ